jgi:serine/threonine-protein kinase
MTPERYRQIGQLYHSALKIARDERPTFLAQACDGDEELLREVQSLLTSHEQVGSFIESPAIEIAAKIIAKDAYSDMVGQHLSHYEIKSLLGAGGMGEVYLAQDMRLGRQVALKLLPEAFSHDVDRVRRFEQEARAASALNHPNILTIYEIERAEDKHFIAMEYIDGETLREKIHGKRTELPKLLKYLQQVAEGLAKAHALGIVHRDLKPDNVMVTRDDYAKILDFGLAKLVEPQRPVNSGSAESSKIATALMVQRSLAGMVMGTAGYMSPEQAQGKVKEIDQRSDIFSFGCILFEAVTKQKPFADESIIQLLHKVVYEAAPPIKDFNPSAPPNLQRVIRRCLAKDPDERYQTIKDVALELKEVIQGMSGTAEIGTDTLSSGSTETLGQQKLKQSPGQTSSAEYIIGEIKQHKRGIILASATLLLAIAGLAYFLYFAQSSKTVIDSVAVLPFKNMTNDPDADYLSDGISESLINNLSQLPQLKVIAQSSTFKYKGKEIDVQEVARALGVQAIVTGRIVQRGDQLQISVEMVDARDKTQVWGEQYNRKATDLLSVQSEISREIAERLRLKLTNAEQQQLAKRETANPQAYELLLKARFYSLKGGSENRKKSIENLNQAIAIDPAYALAYAELSSAYWGLVHDSFLNPKQGMPKVEAAARRALELDESLAEAHLALAGIKRNAWDWATAEREYQRAIELNRNLARAHHEYSTYLSLMGQHEQAIAEIQRARELDPLSITVNLGVGARLYFARQYDQAIEALKKTLELDQNYALPYVFLGYNYAAKGMYVEAIAAYQQFIKLSGDDTSVQISLGAVYAQAGQREKARVTLKRLQTTKEYVSPGELAVLYIGLGEREQAFASLEKAYAAHDLQLEYLGVDQAFDPLRSDPRFTDLIRRVGLKL